MRADEGADDADGGAASRKARTLRIAVDQSALRRRPLDRSLATDRVSAITRLGSSKFYYNNLRLATTVINLIFISGIR